MTRNRFDRLPLVLRSPRSSISTALCLYRIVGTAGDVPVKESRESMKTARSKFSLADDKWYSDINLYAVSSLAQSQKLKRNPRGTSNREERAQQVVNVYGVKVHRFEPSGREIWTVLGRDGDLL